MLIKSLCIFYLTGLSTTLAFNYITMKRRSFVKASLVTGAAATIIPSTSMASSIIDQHKNESQLYELRIYTLKNDTQQKLVEDYLKNAAIPALNRLSAKNVGVFTELN